MHNNDLKLVNKPRAGAMAAAAHVASAFGRRKVQIPLCKLESPGSAGGQASSDPLPSPARAPQLGLRSSRKGAPRAPIRAAVTGGRSTGRGGARTAGGGEPASDLSAADVLRIRGAGQGDPGEGEMVGLPLAVSPLGQDLPPPPPLLGQTVC